MAEALREDGLSRIRLWGPLSPLCLSLGGMVFVADRLHKWWMLDVFDIGARRKVPVTPFLDLVLTWNLGVSYGLLRTNLQAALIGLSLVIAAALWLWASRSSRRLTVAAIGLILGGALSNAVDRMVYGAVADFFHFHVGTFDWYVFNLADVAIVAGVALMLYESLGERRKP